MLKLVSHGLYYLSITQILDHILRTDYGLLRKKVKI